MEISNEISNEDLNAKLNQFTSEVRYFFQFIVLQTSVSQVNFECFFSMFRHWIKCLGIAKNRKMSWKFWLNYWNIQTGKIAMFKQKSYKLLRFSRRIFNSFKKRNLGKHSYISIFYFYFSSVEINHFWNLWLTWNFLIIY